MNRDGRVDIFMAPWFHHFEYLLRRNVTKGGNDLILRVEGRDDNRNPMGIGTTVRLYVADDANEKSCLLGRGDIALANGYSVGD